MNTACFLFVCFCLICSYRSNIPHLLNSLSSTLLARPHLKRMEAPRTVPCGCKCQKGGLLLIRFVGCANRAFDLHDYVSASSL